MNQAQEKAEDFLASSGFQRERFERATYWVRVVDRCTRQAIAIGAGYVEGEMLLSLWTEKLDLFLKYLPHGELRYVDMAHADLAKDGLHRVGTSGQRGWVSSQASQAIEALRTVALPWLDQHVSATNLIDTVMSGQRDGPPESPQRRVFGLFSKAATPSAPYELTPADKQRLGNLYLEKGDPSEAYRWYSEYLSMMNYTAVSNPHRAIWIEALAKLAIEAGR